MRPNFKKPHHIASWHLRCVWHRRHRYCSDLFDLVISCLDLFVFVAILKCKMVQAFERCFPGSVQNTSHEHGQVQLDSTIRFQILGASRTRSELHDHMSLSSTVCVCVYLCRYTLGSEVWIYILSGSFGPCFIMQLWGCDGHLSKRFLAGLAETSRNVPWQICNVTTLPQSTNQLRCVFFTFRRPLTFSRHDNKLKIAMVQLLDWCVFVCVKIWKKTVWLRNSKSNQGNESLFVGVWAAHWSWIGDSEKHQTRKSDWLTLICCKWSRFGYIYSSSFIYTYIYIYSSY